MGNNLCNKVVIALNTGPPFSVLLVTHKLI